MNSGPPPPKRERERDNSSFRGGSRGGESFDNNNNRLYVGNLSWGVDNTALETLFSEQGHVVEAKVVYDRESGRSRGFGFVTYRTADEVNSAIEMLNGFVSDSLLLLKIILFSFSALCNHNICMCLLCTFLVI